MADSMVFSATVRVPGSTANLGPGFDCLGLALTIYDEWTLEIPRAKSPALVIEVAGTALKVPRDSRNLAYRAAKEVFRRLGKKVPALRLRLKSALPMAGGLGSSSAAIVGGLVAANAAAGNKLSLGELVDIASRLEGHPDNVTPALAGGLCAAAMRGGETHYVSLNDPKVFRGLKAVVCSPAFELNTKKARAVLPAKIARADAVFNVGRAATLLLALTQRRWDALAAMMEDKLHEPYRARLIPGFNAVKAAARRAGALGACLSGAGPTVLALAPQNKAAGVARAMAKSWRRFQPKTLVLGFDLTGARLVRK